MSKRFKKIVFGISLMLSTAVCAAETIVAFDTVTAYKVGSVYEASTIYGIEANTGNSIQVTIKGHADSGRSVPSICSPSVLTTMEKPGRYELHVSYQEVNALHVNYCTLILKVQPE